MLLGHKGVGMYIRERFYDRQEFAISESIYNHHNVCMNAYISGF